MNQAGLVAALFLIGFASSATSATQEAGNGFRPPDNDLLVRWDDLNQRLLYHRVVLKPSSVDIYAVDAQGRQTLAIDILKDFPGADSGGVSIDNLAGGPDGSVVLFCLLHYAPGRLKNVILTYSSSGVLKSTIDAAGYEASALAVDERGNIYIFASNSLYDVDDPGAVYPTVVKYDSEGHLVKGMLPSSSFPAGDDPTDSSDHNGGPLLRVTPKGIAVFAALSGRWFLLSEQGEIIAHKDLSRLTKEIADHYMFRRELMGSSFLDPSGWPVFYLRLDDGPFSESNVPPPGGMRFQESLVRVDASTGGFVELEKKVQSDKKQIVGVDKNGNPVYLVHQGNGTVSLERFSSPRLK